MSPSGPPKAARRTRNARELGLIPPARSQRIGRARLLLRRCIRSCQRGSRTRIRCRCDCRLRRLLGESCRLSQEVSLHGTAGVPSRGSLARAAQETSTGSTLVRPSNGRDDKIVTTAEFLTPTSWQALDESNGGGDGEESRLSLATVDHRVNGQRQRTLVDEIGSATGRSAQQYDAPASEPHIRQVRPDDLEEVRGALNRASTTFRVSVDSRAMDRQRTNLPCLSSPASRSTAIVASSPSMPTRSSSSIVHS